MFLKKSSLLLSTVSVLSFAVSLPLRAMDNVVDVDRDLPKTPVVSQPITAHSSISSILSEALDQQVLEKLTSFGLSSENISSIWEDFRKVMPNRGPLKPLSLASYDPSYIAFGLWRAHQTMTYPQLMTETPLPFKSMLSCLLTKEFSSKHKKISPHEAHLLTSLIHTNPYFRKLELFKAGITDTHLSHMGIILHLQELSLEENEITDKGLETVLKYPKLQTLNLSKNKITPEGVRLLNTSPTLLHLNLYKNPTGDEGAEVLSHNTVLTYLDLRETSAGDKGATALANNNTTLTDLRLRYNKITNQGAEAFLNSHHLTHLELDRSQIDEELVFFLEHLMPSNGYLNQLGHLPILPRSALPPQKDRVRILSIDGGGIRGLLPACILKDVADNLTLKTGSPFHFAQHVDLMAGTSTGGIITYGLAMPGERGRPKYTPETLVNLYREKGPQIFPAPWSCLPSLFEAKYDPTGIETYLQEFFEDTYISECCCPTLVASFDLGQNKSHMFDSYEAKKTESKNFQLWGAGRATSAAPTYFPEAKITNKLGEKFRFVDGGIYANNLTLFAIQKAQQLYPHAKEYIVYSLGTGEATKESLAYLGDAGLIRWGLNISDVLMNNAAECTEKLIQAEIKHDARIKYVRIQPHLQASETAMDNVKAHNIENLLKTAALTIEKEQDALNAMIEDFYKDFGQ